MLTTLAIANYRSLRNLVIPLRRLNLVKGANGTGKSSLYRALRLLADTAQGRIVTSLAREGGLESTLWAGPEQIARSVRRGDHPVQGTRRTEPVNLRLGFAGETFGYAIDLGLPKKGSSPFTYDPEIKQEHIWCGAVLRPGSLLVERKRAVVRVYDDKAGWRIVRRDLAVFDSMMGQIADPSTAPEVMSLREVIRGWRFYDHFRTDSASPARLPQIGTFTPVLADDGADLPSAIESIRFCGGGSAFDQAVSDAFPGSRVLIHHDGSGRFSVKMEQHGLLRNLDAAELSDGTLRYLLWIAAFLSPRTSELIVVNEPETSLHPDLLPALARLIANASHRSQMVVVTHSPRLIAALEEHPGCYSLTLGKDFGETTVRGIEDLREPVWHWPNR